jgi:AcrR family transcriptional regulator
MDETIDIDAAQNEHPETLRSALLQQLAHLVDEVEALRTVVHDLPEQIKSGRPAPDVLTMKELYGALATLDSEVRHPRVEQITEQDEPSFSSVDIDERVRESGWNDSSLDDILDRVTEARRALVDRLETLPPEAWHHTATLDGASVTLFDLVYDATQSDAERLRDLGYRLHGAHLSDRDEPLPT